MRVQALRALLASVSSPTSDMEDYKIVSAVGPAYLALSRGGVPAVLIPVAAPPEGIGRRGGGFSLSPANNVIFNFHGKTWQQPAAILECTDIDLTDTFLALALDLAAYIGSMEIEVRWPVLLSWLDGWQALLTRGVRLTTEQELGL